MSIFKIINLRSFRLSLFSIIQVLSLCSSLALATVEAQLHGHISDQSGAAVAGATIRLSSREGLRHSTISDINGNYTFSQLPTGEYLIEIQAANFARRVETFQFNGTQEQTLDIRLDVSVIAEQIVVTASATAQSVDEISKSISVIDAQQIESRNELSISESLRLVPGLRVQQLGGPGSFTTIKTRGLRNEDTAILIDGLRFRDAATTAGDATSFIEDLLVVNTERLEVLRGSGSSLYGTNAIGGAINIITDEGGGPTHGQLQLEGGSLGLFRGRANLAGGTNGGRFGYSAGIAHLNVSNGVDQNDAARNTSGQGRAQYNFTPSISLAGRIFTADAFLQLNDSPFAVPAANLPKTGIIRAVSLSADQQKLLENGRPFQLNNATFIPSLDDPDNRRQSHFFSGALIFTQRLSEAASYRISFHNVTTSRTFRDGPGGVRFEPIFNNSSDFDGRLDTLNVNTDLRIGRRHFVSVGYEFEREYYRNMTRNEDPNADKRINSLTTIKQHSQAFFVQDQLRLLDKRLQFSAAARIQTFALSQPKFRGGTARYTGITFDDPPTAYTGDSSVSYFLASTNTKLRAHIGNGYRAASLFQRFGSSFSSGSFSPFGDPTLHPDRSIAFDTGIDQTLLNGQVQVSATYFYTRLQEVIVFDSGGFIKDPFGRSAGYRNTGGGLARGVDLSLVTTPTRSLNLTLSYTYTNADERKPSIKEFVKSFVTSNHMFTLLVNQAVTRHMNITFDLFAASDYAFPFFVSGSGNRAYIFDGPIKADLGVSYTLPILGDRQLRFYAKGDNIFNRTYFENGFRSPGASFVGGLTLSF
ncbi:MAG: TonB-dependent receptor [Acidobacteriota bacterium]